MSESVKGLDSDVVSGSSEVEDVGEMDEVIQVDLQSLAAGAAILDGLVSVLADLESTVRRVPVSPDWTCP